MKIEKNKVVELVYELEVDGQIVDRTVAERPLDFIWGCGDLLPKFEQNIEGLSAGEKFAFTLTPEEGYGEYDPEKVIELPKEAFIIQGEMRDELMKVGTMVPLVDSRGGIVPGIVTEVLENSVKLDLNSQMAGKTLNFSGEILTVRESTEKELAEGLHGERVHSNCGCHGGCHSHCHEDGCGHCHDEGCGCGEQGCDDDCGCGCKE